VPKYEFSQLAELFEREVRCESGLKTLFAFDTDANIRLHDHAYIVAAVTDRSDSLSTSVVFEGLANFSFLSG